MQPFNPHTATMVFCPDTVDVRPSRSAAAAGVADVSVLQALMGAIVDGAPPGAPVS